MVSAPIVSMAFLELAVRCYSSLFQSEHNSSDPDGLLHIPTFLCLRDLQLFEVYQCSVDRSNKDMSLALRRLHLDGTAPIAVETSGSLRLAYLRFRTLYQMRAKRSFLFRRMKGL